MTAKAWACTLVLILAAAVPAGSQLADAPPATDPGVQNGEAGLMEQWARQRRRIRDEVLRTLADEGRLPRDGTVAFTAKAAPDPERPDRLRVRIESLEIVPVPGAPGASGGGPAGADDPAADMARAFAPVDISRIVVLEGLDVPVDGTLRDSVTMKAGRPVDAGSPDPQGK